MIPRILIQKGNIIRIGKSYAISSQAWGLEIRLTRDCDNRKGGGYIDNGKIVTNPSGWPNPTVNHTLTHVDTLLTPVDMVNADVIYLLKQSD